MIGDGTELHFALFVHAIDEIGETNAAEARTMRSDRCQCLGFAGDEDAEITEGLRHLAEAFDRVRQRDRFVASEGRDDARKVQENAHGQDQTVHFVQRRFREGQVSSPFQVIKNGIKFFHVSSPLSAIPVAYLFL